MWSDYKEVMGASACEKNTNSSRSDGEGLGLGKVGGV